VPTPHGAARGPRCNARDDLIREFPLTSERVGSLAPGADLEENRSFFLRFPTHQRPGLSPSGDLRRTVMVRHSRRFLVERPFEVPFSSKRPTPGSGGPITPHRPARSTNRA